MSFPLRWMVGVAALALAFALSRLSADDLLVWHWRHRLAACDDSQAAETVGRLAGIGLPGLIATAELLASERSAVVVAAERALRAEIDAWPQLNETTHADRGRQLAKALAAHVQRCSPQARRTASQLAIRILAEAGSPTGAERRELLTACEHVLRAAALARRQAMRSPYAVYSPTHEQRPSDDPADWSNRDALSGVQLAGTPGGSLPLGSVDVPALPEADARESGADEPTQLADGGAGRLSPPEPRRLSPEAAANQPAAPLLQSIEEEQITAARLRQREHIAPQSGAEPTDAEATEILRWMHALHATDPQTRARAQEELERQGFEALQLELARQLAHPDPRVRRDLAESLPAMPGIDARPWLLWLSRDEDGEVRLTAITLMATTGDAQCLRRIQQMVRTDSDSRVQRQGERLLGAGDRAANRRSAQSSQGWQ